MDAIYECQDCDRTFASGRALGGHRQTHRPREPRPGALAGGKRRHKDTALPSPLRARMLQQPPPQPPQTAKKKKAAPPRLTIGGEELDAALHRPYPVKFPRRASGQEEEDEEDDDEEEEDEDDDEDASSWTSACAAADAAAFARGELAVSAPAAARALALRGGSREHRYLCTLQQFDERIGAGSHLAATFAEVLHALRCAEAEAACPWPLTVVLERGTLSFEVHRLHKPVELRALEKKRLCHVWLPQEAEDWGGWGWCGQDGTYARRALVVDLESPDLPSSGCAPPPVRLELLHKGAWELQRPGQVRSRGAALRAWASSVLRAWAAQPVPPAPLAPWERNLLHYLRFHLERRHKGFLHMSDYPGGPRDMRTVRNDDGVVVYRLDPLRREELRGDGENVVEEVLAACRALGELPPLGKREEDCWRAALAEAWSEAELGEVKECHKDRDPRFDSYECDFLLEPTPQTRARRRLYEALPLSVRLALERSGCACPHGRVLRPCSLRKLLYRYKHQLTAAQRAHLRRLGYLLPREAGAGAGGAGDA